MKYEEALNRWGAEKLGGEVTDVAVTMDSRIEYGGYCETCSYEESISFVRISGMDASGKQITEDFDYLTLEDILRGVLAVSE